MQSVNNTASTLTSKTFVDSMIRVGLIAILAMACFQVFSPFINIMVWALMLAIMLYPLHQRIARKIGGRQGLAATLMVIAVALVIDPPLVMLSGSFVDHIKDVRTAYENNELIIEQPDPAVAEWPVVGKRLHQAWSDAATNLPKFLQDHAQQVQEFGRMLFDAAGDAIGSVFLFFAAFIIAGIMMAFGKSGSNAMQRIFSRVAGADRGPQLQSLIVATVRSVATGVLGVAFIQALLFGVGFVIAGVPAAGLLALVVMLIGIIQLPAAIIALPVIIYLWASGDASITANIGYTIYFVIAGLSDNVLKPLLLGRGVEAPMPVILIGAIGGLILRGFIGLFLGSILLAVGYQIFMQWVNDSENPTVAGSAQTDPAFEPKPGE